MATRLVYRYDDNQLKSEEISFSRVGGFSEKQKKENLKSFYGQIGHKYPNKKIIEISSISNDLLGSKLSAFNLMTIVNGVLCNVESIYQSSKVFEFGGPFRDLLGKKGSEVKNDIRLRISGKLINFKDYSENYRALDTGSMYYDRLYINALLRNKDMLVSLCEYDGFTDIFFDHKKAFSCQAKTCSVIVCLLKRGLLSLDTDFVSREDMLAIYNKLNLDNVKNNLNISLEQKFDFDIKNKGLKIGLFDF